jgi:hypothetical protein
MNQPDDVLASKVVGYLTEGARNLDPATSERLLAARKSALSHYQGEAAPAWSRAWAVQALGRVTDHRLTGVAPLLIAGAALVAVLIGVTYWQNAGNPANELADVDFGLLTDELPINAYLDRGFDSWLKRSSR